MAEDSCSHVHGLAVDQYLARETMADEADVLIAAGPRVGLSVITRACYPHWYGVQHKIH